MKPQICSNSIFKGNNGQSFTERTYSMLPITTDGQLNSKYIECGSCSRTIEPKDISDIEVTLNAITFAGAGADCGYYIHKIALSPVLGSTFIRALTSEPGIHMLCDKIQEEYTPYKLASADEELILVLPEIFQTLYKPYQKLDTNYGTFSLKSTALPTVRVKVVCKPCVNYKSEDGSNTHSTLCYRNFDFYSFDFKFVDGELAYNTHAKEIEKWYADRSKDNDMKYSGETYELKTLGALTIGKALGRKDIISEVLGRVHPSKTNSSDTTYISGNNPLMHMYAHYIEALGRSKDVYSSFRPDIFVLDADSTIANEVEYSQDSLYLINILRDTKRWDQDFKLNKVFYFNTLADRINMLRELVVLSLPTDYLYPDENTAGKPLEVILKGNDYFKFNILTTKQVVDNMLTGKPVEEAYKQFTDNRELVPSTYTGINPYPDYSNFMGFQDRAKRFDFKAVGNAFVSFLLKFNIVSARIDLQRIKQLINYKLKLTDNYCYDLSELVNLVIDRSSAYESQDTIAWEKPEEWRSLQSVDEETSQTDITTVNYDFSNWELGNGSRYVSVDYYTHPEDYYKELTEFTEDRLYDINPKAFYGYDPIMNIRRGLKLEQAEGTQHVVQSFGSTPTTNFPTDNRALYPINKYMAVRNLGTNQVIMPMLGTYCVVGELPEDSKVASIEIYPHKEVYKDPTVDLSRNRRYI